MSFTSHIFAFYFLPLVLLGYTLIPQNLRFLRKAFLLIASYAFYGWLNPWFVTLVFGTTCFIYILSKRMAQSESRDARLTLIAITVTINLGLLAFFKYAVFFQDNFNNVLRFCSSGTVPVLRVALPVGISFYTFRVLSYVIDIYRGNQSAHSFLDFACYVSFFPQLLSGPIQRYGTIDAQSETTLTFVDQLAGLTSSPSKFSYGAALFVLGTGG